MYIYAESFHVEFSIENDWIYWIKENLIAELHQTNLFTKAIFCKVLSHQDESGNTYSIQCFTNEKENLSLFQTQYSDRIHQLIFKKFGAKVLFFTSEIELLETFEF